MNIFKITAFTALLLVTGCQNSEDMPKAPQSSIDITLRATSDIQTPSPIKAASFVPNSVASWLGHIILLDDKGTLHRATTDSAETDVVALGKYADVLGLVRERKSGVFLALTPQGQIKAFVQTDDEGNFGPLAISQSNQSFEQFCARAEPSGTEIWARTTSGKSQKLTVEVFEDTSLVLSAVDRIDGELDPCAANEDVNLSEDYTLKPNIKGDGLIITSADEILSVDITNGLSIKGIDNIGFVTVTSANMGSVYNEGVILAADEDDGRLVLISLGYALKELNAR